MCGVLEMLMKTLLARKESFRAIFTQMKPIVHSEEEFCVAFFLGYVAHSYKQIFSILTNTDMKHDEIIAVLEFLMRQEPRIREDFASMLGLHLQNIEDIPVKVMENILHDKHNEIVEKVKGFENRVREVKADMNMIKEVAKGEIRKYESDLAKSGKFKKSIMK